MHDGTKLTNCSGKTEWLEVVLGGGGSGME